MAFMQRRILMETFHYTSEPCVSDHRKCKDLVVTYKNRTTGILFQEEVRAHLIYETLFVAYSYAMRISMLLLKFFVYSKYHFAQSKHRDQRIRQEVVAFKRPKKWSRSLTGGGHLLEVPTVRLWLGNFTCFGQVVAYERWSHIMGRWIHRHLSSPTKCENGFVKGEALRILRTNSSEATFEEVFQISKSA